MRLTPVGVVALLSLSCTDEEGSCSSSADCPAGEICVGFGTGNEGTCAVPCADDLTCPTGSTCVQGGNSCPGCEDAAYVCERDEAAPSS